MLKKAFWYIYQAHLERPLALSHIYNFHNVTSWLLRYLQSMSTHSWTLTVRSLSLPASSI